MHKSASRLSLPAAVIGTMTASACASDGVVLIDAQLRSRPIELISLDAERISFVDDLGLRRDRTLAEVAAIIVDPDTAIERASAFGLAESRWLRGSGGELVLTDGQVLLGSVSDEPASDEESLRWSHVGFGEITLPLEEVRSFAPGISPPSRREPAGAIDDDVVRLANGDTLRGFTLLDQGPPLRLIVETTDSETRVEASRVTRATLANPLTPATGTVITLADGSVLELAAATLVDAGVLSIAPSLHNSSETGESESETSITRRVSLGDVRTLVFDAQSLVPLAELELVEVSARAQRRWTAQPRVIESSSPLGARIDMPGPMSAAWSLPAGATRFATGIVLPDSMRVWGDPTVRVLVNRPGLEPQEVWSGSVDGESPRIECAAVLPGVGERGRELVIEIGENENGPVQDRPMLVRPLLLIDPAAD